MADARELILARLLTIASGITGIETAERNLNDLSDVGLPAIILYDGGEEAFENTRARGNAGTTVEVTAAFDIYASGVPEEVGTTINGYRAALIKAVQADTTLAGLCGSVLNSGSRYLRSGPLELETARATAAKLTVEFGINYVLKPDAL